MKAKTKTDTREAFVTAVVQVTQINGVIGDLQAQGQQALGRATAFAEALGFDTLEEAAATITEEERAKVEQQSNGAG